MEMFPGESLAAQQREFWIRRLTWRRAGAGQGGSSHASPREGCPRPLLSREPAPRRGLHLGRQCSHCDLSELGAGWGERQGILQTSSASSHKFQHFTSHHCLSVKNDLHFQASEQNAFERPPEKVLY